jgi:hypothetical protein
MPFQTITASPTSHMRAQASRQNPNVFVSFVSFVLNVSVAILIVGGIFVLQTPVQAQTEDAPLPVSLERIRAALKEQPPALRVPAPSDDEPTFRVEVREPLRVLQPVEETPFDPTFGLPSAGELMMNGIGKVRSAIVNYKRGRAERRARKEVLALAAFCAIHGCPAAITSP